MRKIVLPALLFFLLSGLALADFVRGTVSAGGGGGTISLVGSIGHYTHSAQALSSITMSSFSVGATTDVLLVAVMQETSAQTANAPTSVTWNSVSMTQYAAAGITYAALPTDNSRIDWYYIDGPTAATGDVVVTSSSNYANNIGVYAVCLAGAAAPSVASTNAVTNNTSVSTNITTTVANSWILSAFNWGETNAFSSFGSGQTNITKDEAVLLTASFAITTEEMASASTDTQSATADASTNRLGISSIVVAPQ